MEYTSSNSRTVLGLFMLRDEGPGFPFFLPKGMVLKNTLIDYWRQIHKKYVPGHEHVGVVLGEAAHPEQAVEGPGQLMAVDKAQLSCPRGWC